MARHNDFGRESEKRAEKFLRGQKHRIVARNYHARHGEIDIISTKRGRGLVFTEVRSKHNTTYGHPIETINRAKQGHIIGAARQFVDENPRYANDDCHFDVITIVGEGEEAVLEYFPDAF